MKKIIVFLSFIFILASCGVSDSSKDAATISETIVAEESIELGAENTSGTQDSLEVSAGSYELSEGTYTFSTDAGDAVMISPIDHATAVMQWGDSVVYADPNTPIEGYPDPNIVFVSHEHGDHFNDESLQSLVGEGVVFLTSETVYESLSESVKNKAIAMKNGETIEQDGFTITAVPAYNIREEALNFHPKGKGNGYIFERDGYRVYFSGDSEDTPEMRALSDIDVAFVSMNLPFTMSVDSAASAVLDFAPRFIFPYHYRGRNGFSDIELFKTTVRESNSDIEVIFGDWYAADEQEDGHDH